MAEDGNVKVERLSFGALHEIKEAKERGELVSEEYTVHSYNAMPYDMKDEIDKIKQTFNANKK